MWKFYEEYAAVFIMIASFLMLCGTALLHARILEKTRSTIEHNPKPKKCPKCGRKPEIHGGPEEWVPTFWDPDSGGDPYYIQCKCGYEFHMGYCEYHEFVNAWNRRDKQK